VLVVFPGIAAVVLLPELARPDEAYPSLMSLAPNGIRGLIFVALLAAIVSSLGSMMNSIATIFTMDLYKPMRPQVSEHSLVFTGRVAAFSALVIAALAARPLLGNAEQAFQWLQEFTGFFTPGVVTLFVLGMFWSRTTSAGAFAAAIASAVLSLAYKIWWPEVPFMNRVGYVFLLCVAIAVAVSLLQGGRVQEKAVNVGRVDFSTRPSFNLAAAIIAAILIALYWYWW